MTAGVLLILSLSHSAIAQTRQDHIFEYRKMASNDAGLSILLSGPVRHASNEEIEQILSRAWLKKRIIIYLQMLGFLANDECSSPYPNGEDFAAALRRFKESFNVNRALGLDQATLSIMKQIYLSQPSENSLPAQLNSHNIEYHRADILLVTFKKEMIVQLYARRRGGSGRYTLIKTYPVTSGQVALLGPKMRSGDGLTPEGIYGLDFYPAFKWSDFYLAFRITYPNRARSRSAGILENRR